MKNVIFSVCYIGSMLGFSQPNTEIYLMDLRRSSEGLIIENPENISNNEGYDNQPSFWPDGESLLYSRTIDGQTDITRYYPKSNNTLIISNTKQGSEYSPTPMPDGRISSIRLDTTGLQLLYAYTFSGKDEILVPELKIGYHTWIDGERIVAFVLDEPATMQIINTETNKTVVAGENIGRSLHRIPGSRDFSYVDKSTDQWVIMRMNPVLRESKAITNTLDGFRRLLLDTKGRAHHG